MSQASAPAPAPIIVTAVLGSADFARFDALRRAHFPAERNVLPAHLTMFHHLPPSIEAELLRRLADEAQGPRPAARAAGLFSLGGGVAFRIESDGLVAIRERLANAFVGLLMPQDAAAWRPHVTIQNKVAPTAARALLARLGADFAPYRVEITGLAAWRYRGGPWEPLATRKFRG